MEKKKISIEKRKMMKKRIICDAEIKNNAN